MKPSGITSIRTISKLAGPSSDSAAPASRRRPARSACVMVSVMLSDSLVSSDHDSAMLDVLEPPIVQIRHCLADHRIVWGHQLGSGFGKRELLADAAAQWCILDRGQVAHMRREAL